MKRFFPIRLFLLLLIFFCNVSAINDASARNYLLKTSSSIEIFANHTDVILLEPHIQPKTVGLTIRYIYGRFARPTGFPFPNKKLPTIIKLAITQQPNWCQISLDQGNFEAPIKTFFLQKNQTLNFSTNLTLQSIDRLAWALNISTVELKITAESNGNIQASSNTYDIKIAPTYFLLFSTTWSTRVITMGYDEEKNISVIIQNLGNTKTKFHIEPTGLNDSFSITFDGRPDSQDFILDRQKEKLVNITIHSPGEPQQSFEQALWFTITSEAAEDASVQGESQKEIFLIQLNSLSKHSDESFSEAIPYLSYFAIFLIILPLFILMVLSWRKRQKKHR